MKPYNPFMQFTRRKANAGTFSEFEVELANRNSGMPLETLEHDITPIGQHYVLTHFDIPSLRESEYILSFTGKFLKPFTLTYSEIKNLPAETISVTLECAGNGRAHFDQRSASMPWGYGAVGTSEWTGTRLKPLLDKAGLAKNVVSVSFTGADRGYDSGHEHQFARSLTKAQLEELDILLVYEMNEMPLLPQHGAPLRLIVPGWYGMASVKWLAEIQALDKPFDGHQQIGTYRIRNRQEDIGEPITTMRVKSLMKPPGIPDWASRKRLVPPGSIPIEGRAWSGGGKQITKVEVLLDGNWLEAKLESQVSRYAWTKWKINWLAAPGYHILSCRATDENGDVQPESPKPNVGGFENNAIQRIEVFVKDF